MVEVLTAVETADVVTVLVAVPAGAARRHLHGTGLMVGSGCPVLGDLYAELTAATAGVRDGRAGQERRPRPPIDVNSGRGFAFIDHLGDVYPSGFLPMRCGNVTEQSFREIYATSPVLRSLREPAGFHGACGTCEFAEVCGGSRSHAYAVTGDVLASDPSCLRVAAAVG